MYMEKNHLGIGRGGNNLIGSCHRMLMDLIDDKNIPLNTFAGIYLYNTTMETDVDYHIINEAIESRWPGGLKKIEIIGNRITNNA